MLYQVSQPEFYDIVPEPEYVIYVMICDHIRRLYAPTTFPVEMLKEYWNIRYIDKNNQLVLKDTNETILYTPRQLYLWQKIEHAYINNFLLANINYKRNYDFAVRHFVQSKNEMDKHWKNVKYIVLMYHYMYKNEELSKMLEDNGFSVVNVSDITDIDINDKKYLQSNLHPTEEAWNIITPKFISFTNIN